MSLDTEREPAKRWPGVLLRGAAVGAVVLALALEILSQRLERHHLISTAVSRVLTMTAILLAVGLPTFLVFVRVPVRSFRISVGAAVLILCLSQAVRMFDDLYRLQIAGGHTLIVGIVTLCYALSIALVMLSIYLAFIHMVMAQAESQAERERLTREKQFTDALINSLPGIFYMYDMDGRLIHWNKNHETLTGYSGDELKQMQVTDWYEGADRELIQERVAETFATGDARAEANLIIKNGTRVPYEVVGHRLDVGGKSYLIGLGLDVTVRRRAEEALRRSEERFRTVADNAGSWIWEVDADGKYTYSSHGVERILGYAPDEVVGKRYFFDFFDPESREDLKQASLKAIAEKQTFTKFINANVHKDGRRIILETSGSPVVDEAGNLRGYIGVDRDITQLLHLEAQLRQSQKMEAIGQLAGGVAHDFNNLLQAILGYTNLILEDLEPEDEHRVELMEVRTAAERASSLTRQLLAFSRRQVIQPVGLDLNDVVGSLMKMLKRLIGEHIDLEVVPGHRLGTVHADKGQIEQVLMNLCVNARDAMPTGGRLTIETENTLIDADYSRVHPWAKEGRYVLVSVTDTGCGMDRETQNRIFEPFYTTKNLGEGTGLGLSTVYGIVEQHGGMTQVYSEPGIGTTFKIYLPVWEHAPSVVADEVVSEDPGGTETILIAEDEESILNLAARLLRTAGYTVITASDGEEALRIFEAYEGKIDLVMLDVVMPRLSGRDVQKRISETHPEMRFLFASGYSASAIHTNFVLNEGMLLLQKPYQRNALLRKVREALTIGPG